MTTMQAVQYEAYGDPEVLHVATAPRPTPGPGEVLVRVAAAGVNPHDLFSRSGAMRLITGRRFPLGTGIEFAGAVEESAAGFTAGTGVWGSLPAMKPHTTGAAAEYVAVPADRVAAIPGGLDMVQAASLVVTATTAIRALTRIAHVGAGDAVLIRGAAGGVGLAAVQVAVGLGATVTTLSSARDIPALRELGADHPLDYRTTTARDLGRFDVVLDTVGTDLLSYRSRVRRGGRMITIAFTSARAFLAIGASLLFGSARIRAFSSDAKRDLLDAAGGLVASGALQPVVAQTFPLDQLPAAHRSQASGGLRGKRVVTV